MVSSVGSVVLGCSDIVLVSSAAREEGKECFVSRVCHGHLVVKRAAPSNIFRSPLREVDGWMDERTLQRIDVTLKPLIESLQTGKSDNECASTRSYVNPRRLFGNAVAECSQV